MATFKRTYSVCPCCKHSDQLHGTNCELAAAEARASQAESALLSANAREAGLRGAAASIVSWAYYVTSSDMSDDEVQVCIGCGKDTHDGPFEHDERCVIAALEAALSTPSPRAEALLAAGPDDIRAAGWVVAVHNDYRAAGEFFTFWLFTKDGHAIKGEGRTDAEALNLVRAHLAALDGETK